MDELFEGILEYNEPDETILVEEIIPMVFGNEDDEDELQELPF